MVWRKPSLRATGNARPVKLPPLTGIVCLCMDAFLSGRGRGPCDQRPFPVEVFVEVGEAFVEEAFVEVEETAFAFETPIFL